MNNTAKPNADCMWPEEIWSKTEQIIILEYIELNEEREDRRAERRLPQSFNSPAIWNNRFMSWDRVLTMYGIHIHQWNSTLVHKLMDNVIDNECIGVKWPFSDQKGGNKLLSVAEISARQVLCCYQMLLPDGAGVARSLSLRLDATRWTSQKSV